MANPAQVTGAPEPVKAATGAFLSPLFTDRRVAAVLGLGFAQGIPFLLVYATQSAWLVQAKVPLATIGLMSELTIAYKLKFLWAPFLDRHDAPLDPHFRGEGRVFTDQDGCWQFTTIKPGSYPWRNHHNAWRPNHIHFSLFGPGFATRLITQMYFPGDPLLALDPIFNSVPDEAARQRLIARFDIEITQPEYALGYRFDIVLRGRDTTIVGA